MPIAGFFAVIGVLALMSLTGHQLAPSSQAGEFSVVTPTNMVAAVATTNSRSAAVQTLDASAPEAFVSARISGQPTQDIEVTRALVRGQIEAGSETIKNPFFIYSDSAQNLARSLGRNTTRQAVSDNRLWYVTVRNVSNPGSSDRTYNERLSSLVADTKYYVRLCAEVQSRLRCAATQTFTTNPSTRQPGNARPPSVRVYDEVLVANDEVQLSARVDMRDTTDGRVYVVYGEDQAMVTDAITREYSDIDEDDEDLQRQRLASDVRGTQTFTVNIDDLDTDTQIYYAFCVSYDGVIDGMVCSRQQVVRTPEKTFGDTPAVALRPPLTAGGNLSMGGTVASLNFRNVRVFFVYGTDQPDIHDIGGETTMERIRQNGDRLQRVLVDADLDSSDSYTHVARGLQQGETYAVRLCAQYTNQNDNYRDVSFVHCSQAAELVVR